MSKSRNRTSEVDVMALLPRQFAPAANLFGPVMGAAAAASVVGLGVASQFWGFWAGALAGGLDAARTGEAHVPAQPSRGERADELDRLKQMIRARPDIRDQVKTPVQASEKKEVSSAIAVKDDLKRISGLGPKAEQVLNGMGIFTYEQVAAWTSEEIAEIDARLRLGGRIRRDDWTGQAAALVISDGAR
jgi:NADH-quinone oxidoreductase subunit E